MAIKLPKYQRQVGISAEAGGQRGDISSAGSEWRDIGKIGSQVMGIAQEVVDFRIKKNQAVAEAEVEDASAQLKERERLAEAQLDKIANSGAPDSAEQVDAFMKSKAESDAEWRASLPLGAIAREEMDKRFATADNVIDIKANGDGGYRDVAGIKYATAISTQQMLAADKEGNADSWRRHAQRRVELDPSYSQQDMLTDASQFESRHGYWKFQGDMAATKEQEATGAITQRDAIAQYKDQLNELKGAGLSPEHYYSTKSTLDARITNGTIAQNKTRNKATKGALKDLTDGDYDHSNFAELEDAYGTDRAKDISMGLLQQKAATDSDAMEAYEYLQGFVGGKPEYTIKGLFKKTKKAGSAVSQIALLFANDYLNSLEKDQGSVVAYKENFFQGGERRYITVDKEAGSFLRATMFYSARTADEGKGDGGVSSTVNDKIKAYIGWKSDVEGRGDDEKTFDQFFIKTFAADASQFIRQSPASRDRVSEGQVVDGYRFKGGKQSDPANWEKVQ